MLSLLFSSLLPQPAVFAAGLGSAEDIPHINQRAREGYINYQYAYGHKAFAIAPGGSWAWHAEAESVAEAETAALAACSIRTRQRCVLYAVDDQQVFDAAKWSALWGSYPEEGKGPINEGSNVGEQLYDLEYYNPSGERTVLSALRGKVVVVHFWGSWCPPCMKELPELERLQAELEKGGSDAVKMVLLQVREPVSASRSWVDSQGLARLPISDSGVKDTNDESLHLVDGSTISDRKLASAFPSSYVIDKRGVILFKRRGPIADWLEYLPLLYHAAD